MRPRRTRAAALALACLALLAGPARIARAQDAELPEQLRTIASVRYRGMHAIRKHDLRDAGLRTQPPSRLPWRDRPLLRRDYLVSDSAAIVSLYRHYGYLDARVRVKVEATRDPRAAAVVFDIVEGPRSRVAELHIEGVTAYPVRDVQRQLLAQVGRPFDPAFVVLDTARIYSLFQERGRFVRTLGSAQRDSADPRRVLVRYHVDEGPVYHVGIVTYRAVGDIRESLARRELTFRRGQVYQRSRLDDSIERLYKTTLYRQVQVTPMPDSARATIDFAMRVIERKPRWVDLGIGSGATERIRLDADWGHRNLDARALQGVLSGKLAYYPDPQLHFRDGRMDATLLEPWLFGIRLSGQAGLFVQRTADRTDGRFVQTVDARGLSFQLYREVDRYTRLTLLEENTLVRQRYGLIVAPSDSVSDSLAANVIPNYRTNSVRLTLERDFRDNKVLPKRGTYQQALVELAGGPLRGQSSYRKALMSSVWYAPLRNGWNLATRLSAGVMGPIGSRPATFSPEAGLDPDVARVPRESRFFVGGVNSVRGWGENAIPPGGGLAMLLGNIEVRAPIVGPFGVEAFLDLGNAWSRAEYIRWSDFEAPWQAHRARPGDIRYSYGIGGRVVLPFGPLRIDLAWSDRPDFPRPTRPFRLPFVYQFAIGPSF